MSLRIAVVHEALTGELRPDETDTIAQAEAVAAALTRRGATVRIMTASIDLSALHRDLSTTNPDVVFNLVESYAGQGRLAHVVPALLEAWGQRLTGARAHALALSNDKLTTKRILRDCGIATPAWWALGDTPWTTVSKYRWIIKSRWEHASVGLDDDAVVAPADPAALARLVAARSADALGERFAETFVAGREFNVSLIGGRDPEVLPLAEIDFSGLPPEAEHIVGYRAKWDPGAHAYHHTPRRFLDEAAEPTLARRLRKTALAAWRALELSGYARIDMRVDAEGTPWVLEVNANPCLTPDAGFAAAAAQAGIAYDALIERVVAIALDNTPTCLHV